MEITENHKKGFTNLKIGKLVNNLMVIILEKELISDMEIQNLQKIEQYKISKLTNNNLVVKIPYKTLEQDSYFKSWQDLDDTMMRKDEIKSGIRLFVFNINTNKPTKYLGNNTIYMADFNYLDDNYWVIYQNDKFYISKNNLQSKVEADSQGLENISDFVKDDQKSGIFYITTKDEQKGSRINIVDFKITINNKDDNIVTKFY